MFHPQEKPQQSIQAAYDNCPRLYSTNNRYFLSCTADTTIQCAELPCTCIHNTQCRFNGKFQQARVSKSDVQLSLRQLSLAVVLVLSEVSSNHVTTTSVL